MTGSDHLDRPPGYWPSRWPGECAGPRRQKVVGGPGLGLAGGGRLRARWRDCGGSRWPVMVVERDPGELYLQGGTRPGRATESFGWVEQIDPVTLAPLRASPRLPSGGHRWCGAACVHANGDLYVVNGDHCHRLAPDLTVVAEHRLRTRGAHNGHLALSDGNLVMKDVRADPRTPSTFTVLDPDLAEVDRLELPFASVGRFSADRDADGDTIYVASLTALHRVEYRSGRLRLDPDWQVTYRADGDDRSFAWDSALGDGCAWFMDMGDNAGVHAILTADPVGAVDLGRRNGLARLLPVLARTGLARLLAGQPLFGPPTHAAPTRVWRVPLDDPGAATSFVPFGLTGGGNVAPPLYDQHRRVLVAFDSNNRRIGAFRHQPDGTLEPLWQHAYRTTNQLTLFDATGELVVDDVRWPGRWDAVVVDIQSGQELGRVDTGCLASTGMWYTPGGERDFYTTTSFGRVGRIWVEA